MEQVKQFNLIKNLKLYPNHIFFITNVVYKIYKNEIDKLNPNVCILKENNEFENLKTFESVGLVINALVSNNINRDDYIYYFGGGSLGDLIGFCASIYKRGINLIAIPTTLLCAIDSSVGGKNAINKDGIKNILGTFNEAQEIIIIKEVFLQLNKSLILQGQGEMFKYYLLDENINKNDIFSNNLVDIIMKSIKYKQKIVSIDPKDKGIRFCLNIGHTIGHVIESTLKLSHGISIIHGIYYEMLILYKLGHISQLEIDNIKELYNDFDIKKINIKEINFDKKLRHDKKIKNNQLTLPYTNNKKEYKTIKLSIDKYIGEINGL